MVEEHRVKEDKSSFPPSSHKWDSVEDEIDLMDYVKVILKRKVFILAVFLLVVIIAGIFSFLSPKIYEVESVLEIGQVAEKVVEAPSQIIGKIEGDVYGTTIREKLNISGTRYPQIKAENPKDTNLLSIKIESSNPQQAREILEEKNELVLAEHQEKIELEKTVLENEIYLVEEDINVLQKDIERIDIKISSLAVEKENLEAKVAVLEDIVVYQQDPGSQFALFDAKEKVEAKKQEIENMYLQINSLEGRINDSKSEINSLKLKIDNIRPTLIIKSPSVSENPIKPRPLLNIVIAGILGLFVGTFLAFGREWWEKAR